MKYAIGVDIGGTKTAIGIVDQTGCLVWQRILTTDQTISPKQMIEKMILEVKIMVKEACIDHSDIMGAGIGSPGPLDNKRGVIVCPPNLPEWTDIPVVNMFEQALPYPIRFENDANAAAKAEQWIGAGKGHDEVVYMTISTGIGAGIIAGGKIVHGKYGNAGDIGHTVIDPSFGLCVCGQSGCLESIASGTAIAKHGSRVAGKALTTAQIFELYDQGDGEITELIDKILKTLGIACVNLINTFDPGIIVIGGGVSKVGEPLFKEIREYTAAHALNPRGRQVKIVPAKLEQNSGMIGAAALWIAE